MGEKISHAVAPEIKKLKALGSNNFSNAKMTIVVQSISDSAFVRVEHNYTAPDDFQTPMPGYRLSPNHYWKVDGILPANFKAKATINYDGRTSSFTGNLWLDNLLGIVTEDSVLLMYRRNAAADWQVYPYCTKNTAGSLTDKRGVFTIDSLQLGEYVFAIGTPLATDIQDKTREDENGITVFPNPSKNNLTVDLSKIKTETSPSDSIVITDISGKIISAEKINAGNDQLKINTAGYSNGTYFITVKTDKKIIAKNKFIVSH
jgi:hypothetical protein